MELGKLKKIDLRKFWKHEAINFTTWLSEEENLSLLSQEIGISIKLTRTEAPVGKYSTDILAVEENTGRKIIIENQLETTDHDHLGKIITYASGHDAEIIIWIVKDVRDEHKQALDWLNEHTDEKVNFFAIKMELWQIGNSPPAPKFQIVSKPNDWVKAIKKAAQTGELSAAALQKLEFLNRFISYCKEKGTPLRLSNPQPSTPSYYSISIGDSNAWIAIKINTRKNILQSDLYLWKKEIFHYLVKQKETLEKDYGKSLKWDEMPQHKGAVIGDSISFDIEDESDWDKYFDWIKQSAEKFQNVFLKEIKKVKTSDETD